jgi:elongation factor P
MAMAKTANEVRIGNIIEHQGKRWRVLKSEHVKPGKGGAYCQMELKEITQGTKLNERFRSTENINIAFTETKEYQFLFIDGDKVTIMDTETFEQIEIAKDIFDGKDKYLQDGMTVILDLVEGDITSARVPQHVTFEITETEGVVKGQTAASSNKPATLENGVRVMVPQFINSGDKIIVNTEDDSYVKRADS